MTTAQRLDLVAPSGARVAITLPGPEPVSSVAAAIRFAGGSYGTGFQIGPRGYHAFAGTHVAPATTTDRFLVHGREVIVAEAHDGHSSTAALIGDHHELLTVYAGPAPRHDRVFALFNSLRVTDSPRGMIVTPRRSTLLDTMSEHLVLAVRGYGQIAIPGPAQAHTHIPTHAGARTDHGEVWKVPLAGSGHMFVLGFPAGVAEVQLAGHTQPHLDWLNAINVSWATP
ncbi:hypothetical protein [Actinokineospora globicatena]|uniref:hypothetical protein n=1 Tax=Actinokineospora globicatena TaxID=103729 RepID=UPI0020A522B3|nr:hypothetical protein [Actinokineospora globicatena]MCP2303668.1 hypothetical protein [Actinokineospora globicatena]GLW79195.1 hypothetical protein Aglo01_36770 [Actinokineospora globicatena]GLW86395.1 hypothetical protein Aglo02_40340 [Actinokineospora globicatena]